MRQNPFLFEAEESESDMRFEDSFEFFEDEGEFGEYENEYGETGYEDEVRRRRAGGTRSPYPRPQRFRPRPRFPRRPPKPHHPVIYPASHFSGGSLITTEPVQQSSELIRLVQSLLNRVLGLNLPADGVMNVETRSAIRSFQNQEGSAANRNDGADAEPAAAMTDQPADANDGQGDSQSEFYDYEFDFEDEDEVNRQSAEYGRWIQQSLNKILGFRLAVDGIVGAQTRSAVRSFQQQKGLTVDGIVGPITEAAMIRAGASQPPQASGSYNPPPSTGTPDIVSVRGIQVARQIAPQIESLLAAAARDGVRLGGGGYRSTQQQIQLRIAHCGGNTHYNIYEKPSSQCTPPTAPPGRSNHEKGLAIDFTYNGQTINSHSNPGFEWLAANAARYGLYNLPSEPWHWSVDGR